uniref:Acyl-lipid (7-3)-desaturase n=1 Tax=Diacronema viridis TaxID=2793420 RepID=D6NST0_9EUKA|nr:delta-4 fatty acid desaturase [Diacronema viridis]
MPPSAAKDAGGAAELRAAELASYTRKAVTERSDLTIVGDAVYDAKAFREEHPGGAHFVSLFGGRDATEAFMEYHRRAWPKARMSKFFVGSLAPSEKPTQVDEGYLRLCAEVNGLLPKGSGGFAPASYWLKAAALIVAALTLEGYMLLRGKTLFLSVLLGLVFAWIGLNIQHDANHGALSRYPAVNYCLGYMQDWIGGNMVLWLQEHVVMHHLHTNDVDHDPDQKAHGALRLKPTDSWLPWHSLQQVYILPGEAMYAFKLLSLDALELLAWRWEGEPISQLAAPLYAPAVVCKLAFWARFVALPLWLQPSLHTAACICATVCTGSFYLAFFFFISHNFDGVASVGPQGSLSRSATFTQRQVETSSNVGGKWLAHLNGGLNYQIEHHLFPRLHHSYYATIAPLVRQRIEAMGYKYSHFPTIGSNLGAMMSHLGKMAARPTSADKLARPSEKSSVECRLRLGAACARGSQASDAASLISWLG